MGKISAKNKIFILLSVWLVFSMVMFLYFFGILNASNSNYVENLTQKNKDLAVLNAERESYIQARDDLARIEKEEIKPDNFFSKDTSLVNEIKTLEGWAKKLELQMQLAGVSGTINTLPKAKTLSSIGTVSYSVNLLGSFTQVVNFIEVLENLNFITNINSLSISSSTNGLVNMSLSANLYLKK